MSQASCWPEHDPEKLQSFRIRSCVKTKRWTTLAIQSEIILLQWSASFKMTPCPSLSVKQAASRSPGIGSCRAAGFDLALSLPKWS
jgi:hypothetical protein